MAHNNFIMLTLSKTKTIAIVYYYLLEILMTQWNNFIDQDLKFKISDKRLVLTVSLNVK